MQKERGTIADATPLFLYVLCKSSLLYLAMASSNRSISH